MIRISRVFMLLLAGASLSAPQSPGVQGRAAREKKAAAPKPLAKPIESFQELLSIVDGVREGVLPRATAPRIIRERCIGFAPTPEQVRQLTDGGLPEELLPWIPKAPEIPPPPPPPVAGRLRVACNAADCTVTVNGKPHRVTSGETVEIDGLPAGDTYIGAVAAGYTGVTQMVNLKADAPAVHKIDLQSDRAAAERAGADLLLQLTRSLGGPAGLRRASSVTARAAVRLQTDGREWPVMITLGLPQTVQLSVLDQRGKSRCTITYQAGVPPRSECAKKAAEAELIPALERAVSWLAETYTPAVVEMLLSTQPRITGPAVRGNSRPTLLHVELQERTFDIELNSDGLPAKLTCRAADGIARDAVIASYIEVRNGPLIRFPNKVSLLTNGNPEAEFVFNAVN